MRLDTFAGPGGWSEGLRLLGMDEIGIEWDAAACATRAAAGHLTIRADVAQYPVEPFVGKVRGKIGSPPCPTFSAAGKGSGRKQMARLFAAIDLCRRGWTDAALAGPWDDPRTPLVLQPLRWIWGLRDSLEWAAFEQVPPALPIWERMAGVLYLWGWDAKAVVLNAADYGVPQTRRRAFLLVHRDRVRVPRATHSADGCLSLMDDPPSPWVTMAEALGWSGRLIGNNSVAGVGRAERRADEPALTVGSRADLWVLDRRQDGAPPVGLNRPCPTIPGSALGRGVWLLRPARSVMQGPGSSYVPGQDYSDSRKIELDEAAVLQGFRPGYPWQGGRLKQFEQVGNAVPPPLAAAVVGELAGVDWRSALQEC